MHEARWKIWLMLAPALLVLFGVFMGGLVLGVSRSLGYMPIIGLTEPNLDAYRNLLRLPEFLPSLGMTLYVSIMSTAISMILAIASALLLRRTFRGKRFMTFLFSFNLPIPHIVGAVGIMFLFAQSGFIARVSHGLGLIDRPMDFPILVNDPYAIGIILEYVWKEVPFIGIVVLAVLQSIGDDYEAVARTLGASAVQRFWYVILPLIMPATLSVSILVLAFTFGEFLIPYLLGQTYPATLPVLAVRLFTNPDLNKRPEAMAMSILIAIISAIMVIVYMWISRRVVRSD
jgi:putative spermidine/putrescine transport system permease protein